MRRGLWAESVRALSSLATVRVHSLGLLTGNRGGCFGSWIFIWIYSNWQKCSLLKAKVLPVQLLQTGRASPGKLGFTLWILSAKVSTMRLA